MALLPRHRKGDTTHIYDNQQYMLKSDNFGNFPGYTFLCSPQSFTKYLIHAGGKLSITIWMSAATGNKSELISSHTGICSGPVQ